MHEPEREIEVKLVGLDEESFLSRLLAAGAVFDREEKQTNLRINSTTHPVDDAAYLRLRTIETASGTERELTFKRRLSRDKARVNEEFTVHIDSEEAMLHLLKQLGYDQVEAGYKTRRRYLWKSYRIEFDQWDDQTFPYPFVEVEAPDEKSLERFLDAFDIAPENVTTLSIRELSEAWKTNTLPF